MPCKTTVCSNCSQALMDESYLHDGADGEGYCESCMEELFTICDICAKPEWNDDVIEIDGDIYCERCRDRYCDECHDCGEWIHQSNGRYIDDGDYSVCDRCYDDNYFFCESCEYTFHNDDYGENGYCQECTNRYADDNVELYHYDYKPRPEFMNSTLEKGTNRLYAGWELETECDGDRSYFVNRAPSWIYCKADCSLDYGIEFVSHPMSWQWIKENRKELLNFLSSCNGLYSDDTNTCGMHIHLSKNQFSILHLYKFMLFFSENREFIFKISGRPCISELDRWAGRDDKRQVLYKTHNRNASGRVAINLTNYDTVEIRIFNGTLNPTRFFANLEFCFALFEFTGISSLAKIRVEQFVKWVNRNRKEYPNLNMLLERKYNDRLDD